MNRISIYIEDKIEEARLAGVSPGWLGLTLEVVTKLTEEFRSKMREDSNSKVNKFLNLDIVVIDSASAPADGVYIHDLRGLK